MLAKTGAIASGKEIFKIVNAELDLEVGHVYFQTGESLYAARIYGIINYSHDTRQFKFTNNHFIPFHSLADYLIGTGIGVTPGYAISSSYNTSWDPYENEYYSMRFVFLDVNHSYVWHKALVESELSNSSQAPIAIDLEQAWAKQPAEWIFNLPSNVRFITIELCPHAVTTLDRDPMQLISNRFYYNNNEVAPSSQDFFNAIIITLPAAI